MNEATTTWALVVGFDRYTDPSLRLDGPAFLAVEFVRWLRDLTVPADHILFHACEDSDGLGELPDTGVVRNAATFGAVDDSLAALLQKDAEVGTRLFVYLAGHGWWLDDAGGRVLLYPDAKVGGGAVRTLGLEPLIREIQHTNYRRAFVFFDACGNNPFNPSERGTINAIGPTTRGTIFNGSLVGVAAYASQHNEFALELGEAGTKRSVFGSSLMETLRQALALESDPEMSTRLGDNVVVNVDGTDGLRTVDLRLMFDGIICPSVAALSPQNPQLGSFGNQPTSLPMFALTQHVLRAAASFERFQDEKRKRYAQMNASPREIVVAHWEWLSRARVLHHGTECLYDCVASLPCLPEAARVNGLTVVRQIASDLAAMLESTMGDATRWKVPDDQAGDFDAEPEKFERALQQIIHLSDGAKACDVALVRTQRAVAAAAKFRTIAEAAFCEEADFGLVNRSWLSGSAPDLRATLVGWIQTVDSRRLTEKVATVVAEAAASDAPFVTAAQRDADTHWTLEARRQWRDVVVPPNEPRDDLRVMLDPAAENRSDPISQLPSLAEYLGSLALVLGDSVVELVVPPQPLATGISA